MDGKDEIDDMDEEFQDPMTEPKIQSFEKVPPPLTFLSADEVHSPENEFDKVRPPLTFLSADEVHSPENEFDKVPPPLTFLSADEAHSPENEKFVSTEFNSSEEPLVNYPSDAGNLFPDQIKKPGPATKPKSKSILNLPELEKNEIPKTEGIVAAITKLLEEKAANEETSNPIQRKISQDHHIEEPMNINNDNEKEQLKRKTDAREKLKRKIDNFEISEPNKSRRIMEMFTPVSDVSKYDDKLQYYSRIRNQMRHYQRIRGYVQLHLGKPVQVAKTFTKTVHNTYINDLPDSTEKLQALNSLWISMILQNEPEKIESTVTQEKPSTSNSEAMITT